VPFSVPTGIVTFLLTDIESSTSSWEVDGAAMGPAVSRHYELLDEYVARWAGVRPVEQGEGDSIVAAFSRPSDAVNAALDAQRALLAELAGQFRVRMALHTGEAQLRDEANYFGRTVIRCARLRSCAHGGQVVLSAAAADLVVDDLPQGTELHDLGLHRLRDLQRPELGQPHGHRGQGRRPGGRGPHQRPDRGGAAHGARDGQDPHVQRAPQARPGQPHPAGP
jgi:class 3 adenylate cyclase